MSDGQFAANSGSAGSGPRPFSVIGSDRQRCTKQQST